MEPRLTFLDTHAAVFLWEGREDVWGARSAQLLSTAVLRVSPVVRLELRFLHEVGKLKVEADTILGGLAADCQVQIHEDPLTAVVSAAMGLAWTRDPFDRLIVATAALQRAPLITRDRRIQQHYPRAVW
ncbi:MAG: PIN domain-containing protein [Candidatus Riflebacteria bacterium]|nr:PIN domain-containing protein [Candidatus Riflebacteria bacterium]